jgi:hypothetical protein
LTSATLRDSNGANQPSTIGSDASSTTTSVEITDAALRLIFEQLTFRSYLPIQCVCKRWRALVIERALHRPMCRNTWSLWRFDDVAYEGDLSLDEVTGRCAPRLFDSSSSRAALYNEIMRSNTAASVLPRVASSSAVNDDPDTATMHACDDEIDEVSPSFAVHDLSSLQVSVVCYVLSNLIILFLVCCLAHYARSATLASRRDSNTRRVRA